MPTSRPASDSDRLARLRAALAALPDGPDAVLLSDIGNLGYVSGFSGSTAQALVSRTDAVFITDARYTLRALAECKAFKVVETPQGSGGYGEALQSVLKDLPGVKRLGFEAGHVSVSAWEKYQALVPSVGWAATTDLVETLRLTKDAGEVEAIRRAIAVAEDAMSAVKHLLAPGTREQDFALELEFAMRRRGASGAAFDTIVASGALGAHPHHQAGPRPLAVGDFVTVDWGAVVGGYCSDITRTFAIGAASDRQREVYGVVLEAQTRAIAAIRPGRTGQEIDAVARDFIAAQGFGDAFGHSLGHSLGRSVHDGPGLSVRSESLVLAPGMVMTVEPGIYLENWGGVRVEEDVLVTDDGCEILTHLPNGLEVL